MDTTDILAKLKGEFQSYDPLAPTRGQNIPEGSIRAIPWRALENVEFESQTLISLLKRKKTGLKYFSKFNASEENFKALSGDQSPFLISIMSHGFFYPDLKDKDQIKNDFTGADIARYSQNPLLRSGLILAGANYKSDRKQEYSFFRRWNFDSI